VSVEELQELLLVREVELMRMEEALTAWEEKVGISKKALAKVRADLNTERTKAEATQKEYLDKMVAQTTRPKHSLGLNKILREKKVELNGRERDLELLEAVLVEAQTGESTPRTIMMSWWSSLNSGGFFRTPRQTTLLRLVGWRPWWGTWSRS
jgi:hypothetical protein